MSNDANMGAPGVPPAPAGGGFGGGSFDPDEGNFKKGATKPILIVLGILVAVGAVVLAIFAAKGESDKMTVDQIVAERKAIAVLPKKDQLPKWREWAKRDDVMPLQEDAFAQLAWAKDEQGLKTIIEHGLGEHADHKIRNRAAQALADYGSPMADQAKPALLKALKEANSTDKPQIAWALCVLKESSAFDDVLSEYRLGHLASTQRLDGYPAFDPATLAKMVTLDKLATYANDPSDSMRQLIATILSQTGDAKWTQTLITLVQDKEPAVGREAAVGLERSRTRRRSRPCSSRSIKPRPRAATRVGTRGRGSSRRSVTASAPTASSSRFAPCRKTTSSSRRTRSSRCSPSSRTRAAETSSSSTSSRTRTRTGRPRPPCASPRSATSAPFRTSLGA